jgi:REP element-mobilizing transposase RayT
MPETLRFYRRHLPHWLVADRTYFVTIRQKGTLPAGIVNELREERERLHRSTASSETALGLLRKQFARVESVLHSAGAAGNLTDAGVPEILVDSIDWFEAPSRGWMVYAATVMSTHMHFVMRNDTGRSAELLSDMGHYKNYTARETNRIRGRKGSLWAREDFDHWCRTPEKVEGAVRYVRENPVEAGLCSDWTQWPWTRVKNEWKT